MESLEWAIRHHPSNLSVHQVCGYLGRGALVATRSPYEDAAQNVKRDFLVRVIPLTYRREWDDPTYRPPAGIINPSGAWSYNQQLMYLAIGCCGLNGLGTQDYDLLLKLLNGEIREKVEPDDTYLMPLLWGRRSDVGMQRTSGDEFLGFLRRLEGSPRRLNQIIAKVAMLSWQVDHGRRVDADVLRQIEMLLRLRALVLERIPWRHQGVTDELDRLRSLGFGDAATRPDVAAHVSEFPDLIEQGPFRLEKLSCRWKRLNASVASRPEARKLLGLYTVVNCNSSLDVMWNGQSVNLMCEGGFLEEIADIAQVGNINLKIDTQRRRTQYTDVKWDGRRHLDHDGGDGVWAADLNGKVLASIGAEQGLPPMERGAFAANRGGAGHCRRKHRRAGSGICRYHRGKGTNIPFPPSS